MQSIGYKINFDELVSKIFQIVKEVRASKGSEEDLKQRMEEILRDTVKKLGVLTPPKYEETLNTNNVIARGWGRIDARYASVIIEYKSPGELKKSRVVKEAIHKMKEVYIPELLNKKDIKKLIKNIRKKEIRLL